MGWTLEIEVVDFRLFDQTDVSNVEEKNRKQKKLMQTRTRSLSGCVSWIPTVGSGPTHADVLGRSRPPLLPSLVAMLIRVAFQPRSTFSLFNPIPNNQLPVCSYMSKGVAKCVDGFLPISGNGWQRDKKDEPDGNRKNRFQVCAFISADVVEPLSMRVFH